MTFCKAAGCAPAISGTKSSGPNASAGRLAIALSCSTMLAGVPCVAFAQDQSAPEAQPPATPAPVPTPAPTPNPTPAPAPAPSNIIRTISVSGAERLAPTSILYPLAGGAGIHLKRGRPSALGSRRDRAVQQFLGPQRKRQRRYHRDGKPGDQPYRSGRQRAARRGKDLA